MIEEILERLPDHEFVIIDGFDDAVIGVCETSRGNHLLCKLSLVYDILLKEDGIDNYTDSVEWYSFNMISLSYLDNGPVFLDDLIMD